MHYVDVVDGTAEEWLNMAQISFSLSISFYKKRLLKFKNPLHKNNAGPGLVQNFGTQTHKAMKIYYCTTCLVFFKIFMWNKSRVAKTLLALLILFTTDF